MISTAGSGMFSTLRNSLGVLSNLKATYLVDLRFEVRGYTKIYSYKVDLNTGRNTFSITLTHFSAGGSLGRTDCRLRINNSSDIMLGGEVNNNNGILRPNGVLDALKYFLAEQNLKDVVDFRENVTDKTIGILTDVGDKYITSSSTAYYRSIIGKHGSNGCFDSSTQTVKQAVYVPNVNTRMMSASEITFKIDKGKVYVTNNLVSGTAKPDLPKTPINLEGLGNLLLVPRQETTK